MAKKLASAPTQPVSAQTSSLTSSLLTVCVITRNGAVTIEDALDSLRGLANEFIVVDTGSTDSTQAVVKSYADSLEKSNKNIPLHLIDFPQLNSELDFAAARNKALTKASGQWVLMLEQDEVLTEKDARKVHTILSYDGPEAYLLTRRQYRRQAGKQLDFSSLGKQIATRGEGATSFIDVPNIRLFKNKKYRYKYRIFETLEDALFEKKAQIAGADIFFHAFPSELPEQETAKNRLYLSILEKQCSEHPHDPKLFFDRACMHEELGEDQQALVFFQKAAGADEKHKHKHMLSKNTSLYYRIAVLLLKAGKRDEAEQQLRTSIEFNAGLRPSYLLLAALLFQQARPRAALQILVTALRNNITDPEILNMVGFGLIQDSKTGEAVKILEKAKAEAEKAGMHTYIELVYNNLYTAYLLSGNGDKAITLLEAAITQYPGTVSFYTNLINLLVQVQQPEKARSYCTQVLKLELEPILRQQLETLAKSIS
ncbi:MAG: glycosyltransferase [Candidatus Woesearchaeota archaeon]|nr:glycosyltransferase [Candidatus Woesearchaeota archaeon]